MNYITEINRFYDWIETNQVPKSAIALWHGLMHINNKSGWPDKFTVAISVLEFKTGFKKSELNQARNILTQKGRIKWRSRGGNLCAEYEMIGFSDQIAAAKAITSAAVSADTIATTVPPQTGTINKLKEKGLDKTKLSSSGAGTPAKVKDDAFEKVIHWKQIVDTWFVYYKKIFTIDPTFNGEAAKNLKRIIDRLKKLSEAAIPAPEWTEEYACRVFTRFLDLAVSDQWLKDNFLLSNLYSKFDSIIQKANGTGKQQTGGGVSTASAFSKIDQLS